ncbi:DUF308 domain-containing protein [Phenylobacterium sp.]|uniref:DUF308 domain-containing protein n=1 Tax=Phenylobacterium sp. TaxID=1871053 RepID=UPI0035B173B5
MTSHAELHPFGPVRLRRGQLLAAGVAMTLLGAAAPLFPREATLAVGAAAGWLVWLAGAVLLGVSLLLLPKWLYLTGVVASLFITGVGVYLTFQPATGALAAALLLAAVFVADGSLELAMALRLRPLKAWRWMLASALASLVAAGLIGLGLPERSTASIGLLLGLAFVTTGLGLVAVALTRRPDEA